MEEFQKAKGSAETKIKIADHILTQTYPLVKDPKLLIAVMENIFLCLTNAMGSVLYFDRKFKRVPSFVDNFENKFELFKTKCVPRYKIDKKYINLISEVKEAVIAHRKSPVEFARKGDLVICSDNYKMKTVTVEKLKNFVSNTKSFLKETNSIILKNERIFRRI